MPDRVAGAVAPTTVAILSPVLSRGGTEAHVAHLARALCEAGYGVSVCCYFESDRDTVSELERIGARVTQLDAGQSRRAGHPRSWLGVTRRLFRYLRELRPDIVHVQYLAPGLLPIVVSRLARVPAVLATVHQPAFPYGARQRRMLRAGARLCRSFWCVSRAVEESWFGDSAVFDPATPDPRRRHVTIYNGVDCAAFSAEVAAAAGARLARDLNLEGRPVVTVVGRLRQEKGHRTLIEAIARVVRCVPDAALLIVGDGPDRAELEQVAVTMSVDERTVWAGQRPNHELPGFYALSSVVTVPSLFEGFGFVAAEGMAAGKVVVASAVGGLPEVVEDGVTGLLVQPGDSAALATALVRVLDNPDVARQMGRRGQDRVQALFSIEQFQRSIAAAYGALAL